MKKTLLSLAVATTLGLASTQASAVFLDFQVDEGSVPGAFANTFTADKLNGGYTEFLAPTSATTFSAAAVGNLGQYFSTEGSVLVASQLNGTQLGGLTNGYGLYAIFTASGNITGPNEFQGTGGGFSLYVDPDQNTTFTSFNSGMNPFVTPTADAGTDTLDYLIASTFTTVSGSGNLNGPPGAFDIIFKDFVLTIAGEAYFVDPDPFHMIVQVNGDYDTFSTTPVDFGGGPVPVSRITGDVSAVFVVPEPGSLALVGLALAGVGLTQRRRKAK